MSCTLPTRRSMALAVNIMHRRGLSMETSSQLQDLSMAVLAVNTTVKGVICSAEQYSSCVVKPQNIDL